MTRPWSRDPLVRTALDLAILLGLFAGILLAATVVYLAVVRCLA